MIILRYLYSFYTVLLFMITLPFPVVFYFLTIGFSDRKKTFLRYKCNYYWLTLWSFLCGLRYKFEGMDSYPKNTPSVLVCNHSNMLDIPFSAIFVSGLYCKPLVKEELLKIPLLGYLFKTAAISVSRDSAESRKESVRIMVENVKDKGMSIFVFPEGTRNKTNKPLKSFYDGAFKIAIETKVPIQVMAMLNIRTLQPVGTNIVKPGLITLKYIQEISTDGLTIDDVPRIKEEVFQILERELLTNDKYFNKS